MIDLLRERENSEQVHRFSRRSFVGQGFVTKNNENEPKVEKNSGTKSVVSGSDERGLRGVKTTGFLRFYYSNIGRWISRDPIEEKGSVNIYCFVRNSPSLYFDYLGLDYADTHRLKKCEPGDCCPVLMEKANLIIASIRIRIAEMESSQVNGQGFWKWYGHQVQILQQMAMANNCVALILEKCYPRVAPQVPDLQDIPNWMPPDPWLPVPPTKPVSPIKPVSPLEIPPGFVSGYPSRFGNNPNNTNPLGGSGIFSPGLDQALGLAAPVLVGGSVVGGSIIGIGMIPSSATVVIKVGVGVIRSAAPVY